MTDLIFEKIRILSKVEKKARTISFGDQINLLIGKNDVGKSTIAKSLYHTLGADVPQLDNSRWKKANPIYCSDFLLNGKHFKIIRDGRFFGVFDQSNSLIHRYQGIGGENGISKFWCNQLKFRIELEKSQSDKLGTAGPAFYFLPFYVDQDEGWQSTWSSFSGLRQFSNYRKHMLDYHLGIRPQSYYDAKKKELALREQANSLRQEIEALLHVEASYKRKKLDAKVDIDPVEFREEIEELVEVINSKYSEQQTVLSRLKEARSELHIIEEEIRLLQRSISELDADYQFATDPLMPDTVDCPTCGTAFSNSIAERFGLLDDIEYCHQLIDDRRKRGFDAQARVREIEDEYKSFVGELTELDSILRRKKESVTFSELITSEGVKELLATISEDILSKRTKLGEFEDEISRLADQLKVDQKRKKKITEYYQSRMKQFLNVLNVNVLEEDDYKSVEKIIKNNALGSDLPRSLLAQYFALMHTMAEFNTFVMCPMVIDSPQQQEQDTSNLNRVFHFIFERLLPKQQLILATVSLSDVDQKIIPDSARMIELDEELSVLKSDEYDEVSSELEDMHATMLDFDE